MDILMIPLTLAGMGVMALLALGCIIWGRGKNRRYLMWTGAAFLGLLVLYAGGIALLGRFGLTWRNMPALILCGLLLGSGWVGVVLTLACFLKAELPRAPAVLRWAAKTVAVLFAAQVLVVTVWLGPMVLAFGYGDSERVVEYEDRLLVERMEGFLSPDYSYYAYHGPLFRGTERIFNVRDAIE